MYKDDSHVDQAFAAIDRKLFLPDQSQEYADANLPLPIGQGQTNSQPSTVYKMLSWLDVQEGGKVLDVGSGSGWTTALLAYLVGKDGFVHGVERIEQLVEFGKNNCAQAKITNVQFHLAADQLGLPDQAPFDRILVSASANELPQQLFDQLKAGGKMVIPIKHSIHIITKSDAANYQETIEPGFAFVPLILNDDDKR